MPRVVHFEIYGEQPDKLIEFYSQIFNWTFEKWGDMEYWIIKTGEGPGIDGGLGTHKNPSVNTIDVPNVDEYLKKIKHAGGKSLTIQELMKKNPKGKNIRIVG